ncbi:MULTISPECIES: hypothetical protein [Aequorivita]|uniref:MFS transporter n=2 Tax=Aequorivita TaxID=153265 RepID=A0AB35YP03_9FLAO|nr:hypothetical protein [Aequorivita sp. Ant34-E75]WGF91464.1 hypothetical protein QCQ61_09600 [Aequorivita sp. Ant34-E75]
MSHITPAFTPKSFLKTISIIHFALVMGVSLFIIVMYLQSENQNFSIDYMEDSMIFVVPIIAVVCILIANFLYTNMLKALTKKVTLKEKLSGFQTASLVKYALLEAPAFLAIVAFINKGNQYFLIISLILLGWLLVQKPSRDRIETDLQLEGKLKSEFQQEEKPLL